MSNKNKNKNKEVKEEVMTEEVKAEDQAAETEAQGEEQEAPTPGLVVLALATKIDDAVAMLGLLESVDREFDLAKNEAAELLIKAMANAIFMQKVLKEKKK